MPTCDDTRAWRVRLDADTGRIFYEHAKNPSIAERPTVLESCCTQWTTTQDNHGKFGERLAFERLCGFHLLPDWTRHSHFSRQAKYARRSMRRWAAQAPWRHTAQIALNSLTLRYHETLVPASERKPATQCHSGPLWLI
jgi:hypothetical protein